MFFVATTSAPYARPTFEDADTLEAARKLAAETMRKLTIGFSGKWVEVEEDLWSWRNEDGSARFDAMYVEIGQD